MSKIALITGGARSGKSTYGEKMIADRAKTIAYVATAIAFDGEMSSRIAKHKAQRPAEWTTFENWKTIDEVVAVIEESHDGLILDCLTIMVTNWMLEDQSIDWEKPDPEKIYVLQERLLTYMRKVMNALRNSNLKVVMITNELGMGIVPENPLARAFRDIAGRVNQLAAAEADEVWLTVCGQPMKIK